MHRSKPIVTGTFLTIPLLIAFAIGLVPLASAQTQPRQEWTNSGVTDDRVTFSETLPIDQAMKLMGEITLRTSNKVIIDNSGKVGKIGVEIVNLSWRRALELISKKNELEYEEESNFIRVYDPLVKDAQLGKDVDIITATSREVTIEAVFFEADRNALREVGVNWSTLSSGEVNAVASQDVVGNVTDNNIFTISIQKTVDKTLSVSGIVKTFENKGLGTILANPLIRVRAGRQGSVHVGQDFSIKTRDFAGNTIDNFISAGTMLTVTPTVYIDNDVTFVHLKLDVERSTGNVSALTTTINKSKASTSLLMLPNEEAAIGGLYSTEKSESRKGIPFLRDLPPWVLGIRYLTGYERVNYANKELVILLKVSLEKDLVTRMKEMRTRKGLQDERQRMEQRQGDLWQQSGLDK
ncbi:MAG: type II and III secretion system protein [bacterium]|nr:type II and III secretion system protein [bacterium]